MTDKPKFINTPPQVEEQVEEAVKYEEQKKKRKEKAIVPEPPKPMEWWIQWIIFWSLAVIVVIQNTVPIFRAIKYTATNNAEINFVKENTEMVKSMRLYREARIKEVDDKITEAFK